MIVYRERYAYFALNNLIQMKKFLNVWMLAAIAAGVVFVSGCSEVDEPTDPQGPTETTCYMTQEVSSDDFETETTQFVWNAENQLVTAISDEDTTEFEYRNGKLVAAYEGASQADLVYDGSNTVPSRINLKEFGRDAGYVLITSSNGSVTKAEFYDDEDVMVQTVNATYDASNNITAFTVDMYDEEGDSLTTFLKGSNIQNDGKKNPYSESFAFVWLNIDNPVALGASNVTTAQVAIAGQNFPYTATYTYNDNDYPLTSKVAFFLGSTDLTFTYNCK
jgi:PBP1b-binding outer membrane lipoprotein LpoB